MNPTDDTPLYVEQMPIGPMQNFCYLVASKTTRDAVLIDPAWDPDSLLDRVEERGFNLKGMLVTHYHPDHCGGGMRGHHIPGVADVLEKQGVKTWINRHEVEGLQKVTGLSDSDIVAVDSGDRLSVGEIEIEFLHTPGHTPGSQCFRIQNTLVSGDTLFIQGCGRVDLPGSNSEDMYRSLQKLAELPDDTLLLPGHHYSEAPNATMAETKAQNVYMRVPDLDTWKEFMG